MLKITDTIVVMMLISIMIDEMVAGNNALKVIEFTI